MCLEMVIIFWPLLFSKHIHCSHLTFVDCIHYFVISREKIEQTSSALEERMMSKVDELSDQLKDLKYLLERIDKAKAGQHGDAPVEESPVIL